MIKNTKALTSVQAVLLLIALIVVVVIIGAYAMGGTPETANQDITVYINDVKQDVNYSAQQTLDWGAITAGNVYTKNFNVTNTGTQNYTLLLLTTEPAGTSQTWAFNNTMITPMSYAAGSLTLTLSTSPSAGAYTWRLLATNSTSNPVATPTPNPSATPTPNNLQFTIEANMGVQSVNITQNTAKPFAVLAEEMPKTYVFTEGTTLRFLAIMAEGYEFNGFEFDDGSLPVMTNPLTITGTHGNFTITVKSLLAVGGD